MTYHRGSDVRIPFGRIVSVAHPPRTDWVAVTKKKYREALWIASDCYTRSNREEYIKILQKYIDVDVVGKCSAGKKEWNCGKRYVHDDCYNVLNDYKFFLAFESSLCEDYITEKIFENYNYDVVIVVRGGNFRNNTSQVLQGATYINVDSFESIEALGLYLQELGRDVHQYASILESKSRTVALPFHHVYQNSLCTLCDTIHSMSSGNGQYKHYTDLREFYSEDTYCSKPVDLTETAHLQENNITLMVDPIVRYKHKRILVTTGHY